MVRASLCVAVDCGSFIAASLCSFVAITVWLCPNRCPDQRRFVPDIEDALLLDIGYHPRSVLQQLVVPVTPRNVRGRG